FWYNEDSRETEDKKAVFVIIRDINKDRIALGGLYEIAHNIPTLRPGDTNCARVIRDTDRGKFESNFARHNIPNETWLSYNDAEAFARRWGFYEELEAVWQTENVGIL
ncbi:hypothetical protein HBI18_236900, partial [Parastagonospora nodorum]